MIAVAKIRAKILRDIVREEKCPRFAHFGERHIPTYLRLLRIKDEPEKQWVIM